MLISPQQMVLFMSLITFYEDTSDRYYSRVPHVIRVVISITHKETRKLIASQSMDPVHLVFSSLFSSQYHLVTTENFFPSCSCKHANFNPSDVLRRLLFLPLFFRFNKPRVSIFFHILKDPISLSLPGSSGESIHDDASQCKEKAAAEGSLLT